MKAQHLIMAGFAAGVGAYLGFIIGMILMMTIVAVLQVLTGAWYWPVFFYGTGFFTLVGAVVSGFVGYIVEVDDEIRRELDHADDDSGL